MRWRRCCGRCDGATSSRSSGSSPMAASLRNDRKARFVAPEIPALRTETTAGRPLRLNTGRIRDQWHTMTRSGMSPRLGQHLPEPFVEVHPDDAIKFGVADGGFARVTTDYGQCTLKVAVSARQQRGMLFAPIHWSEATASAARVGALVAPFTDPFSGQPESKATPASIAPYEYVFRGFALSRTPLQLPDHALVGARGGHRRLRLSVRRQCRSGAMAVMAAIGRRRGSRRIPGFRRRRLSRGIVCRRPHRDLPVRRSRARCRRLGRGQEPVRRRISSATTSAGCCCRANRPTGWPAPARSSAPASASAATRSATPSRRVRNGRRDRRAVEGRHQLRLLHSGIEAADRADADAAAATVPEQRQLISCGQLRSSASLEDRLTIVIYGAPVPP